MRSAQNSRPGTDVRPVEVPDELRAAAGLARPDWADAFAARLPPGAPQDLEHWQDVVLRTGSPAWVQSLMRVRGVLARALRLHTARWDSGPFPVISRTEERIVSGANDRHLDFRVVLAMRSAPAGGAGELLVVTVVQRHNAVGRAYFALIGPFHRRIVPALMRRAVLTAAAGGGSRS